MKIKHELILVTVTLSLRSIAVLSAIDLQYLILIMWQILTETWWIAWLSLGASVFEAWHMSGIKSQDISATAASILIILFFLDLLCVSSPTSESLKSPFNQWKKQHHWCRTLNFGSYGTSLTCQQVGQMEGKIMKPLDLIPHRYKHKQTIWSVSSFSDTNIWICLYVEHNRDLFHSTEERRWETGVDLLLPHITYQS